MPIKNNVINSDPLRNVLESKLSQEGMDICEGCADCFSFSQFSADIDSSIQSIIIGYNPLPYIKKDKYFYKGKNGEKKITKTKSTKR